MPTISTSSPTLTMPRSMRPVTTVPRPEIENTSSIGIRNGWSFGRCGCGMYSSTAFINSRIAFVPELGLLALQSHQRRALDHGDLVARELVQRQQLAHLHLDQLDQVGVVDHVDLVHEHHQRRHADLAGQQDVLARLRHRAVGRRHHQDGAVHLRRTRDHVLHVVGVAGAVDVRVVAVLGLVLDVRGRDRDAALALLGSLVDLVVGRVRRPARLGQNLRDRSRQRRLAVIDMTDRPDVAVRLRSARISPCAMTGSPTSLLASGPSLSARTEQLLPSRRTSP